MVVSVYPIKDIITYTHQPPPTLFWGASSSTSKSMRAQTSQPPTHKHPWSRINGAALKAAAGSAFLMAAVFEAISVWINGSQHRLLEVLQWLFPIVGALIGYLSTL